MSFIPQVTCRNCNQQFSALRGRCPNCGARYVKQTVRTTPTTASTRPDSAAGTRADANGRWQMIFGGVLTVAVIVAVIILISASLNPVEPAAVEPAAPSETPDYMSGIPVTDTPETVPPTETPTPTVPVTSITITYGGRELPDFTQRVGQAAVTLTANVYPTEALLDAQVEWRSSDPAVATVDENGAVTAVAHGNCQIIASCGGMEAKTRVIVP